MYFQNFLWKYSQRSHSNMYNVVVGDLGPLDLNDSPAWGLHVCNCVIKITNLLKTIQCRCTYSVYHQKLIRGCSTPYEFLIPPRTITVSLKKALAKRDATTSFFFLFFCSYYSYFSNYNYTTYVKSKKKI